MRKSSLGLAVAALLACVPAACGTEQAPMVSSEPAREELVAIKDLRSVIVERSVVVGERLTRAEAAVALNVNVSHLLEPTVLTPAKLAVQNARMELYCAAEVLPGSGGGYTRIVKSLCQGFGQASIFFEVVAGHTYLIDWAVKPGNTTWKLRRWGESSGQTVSNTEHPLFAFSADTTGVAGFSLEATANEFFVYSCEITAAN